MGGRVDVEADNVLQFLCEFRIVRQLECPDAMGGELMGRKDVLDGTVIGQNMKRHRHQEFIRFLNTIEA
jgi:hypothetical protein